MQLNLRIVKELKRSFDGLKSLINEGIIYESDNFFSILFAASHGFAAEPVYYCELWNCNFNGFGCSNYETAPSYDWYEPSDEEVENEKCERAPEKRRDKYMLRKKSEYGSQYEK